MIRRIATTSALALAAAAIATPAAAEPYRWPVNPGPPVTAYYDHGQLRDWRCQNNTYNGHKGTDIGVPRNTQVFAAANGRVKHRTDGYGDGFLGSTDGGGFGNAVALYHGAGDETIYGHFTAGTGIPALDANITCSAPIGRSGASGNVTGPHVHFETRINVSETGSYYSGSADDPYAGPCGGPLSYWTNQNNGSPTATCAGAPATTDGAGFVADVTIPDGTQLTAGEGFVKTWRLRNTGTSTWGGGYQLVHVDGPTFGGNAVAVSAGPGAEVNVSIDMTASGSGVQRSRWQMAHDGTRFGTVVWVEIDVRAAPAPDADGDGVPAGADCDDSDPSVHPGADETCDGRDANCDGAGDDGLTRVCCDSGVATCSAGAWGECSQTCDDPFPEPEPEPEPDPSDDVITGGCASSSGRTGGAAALLLALAALVRRRR